MIIKRLISFIMLLVLGGYAFGQFGGDGPKNAVIGSAHDFRGDFASSTAVCEFCHVPHKFNSLATNPPLLWNVQVKPGPYGTYSSSSFDGELTVRDPSTASPTNNGAYMSLLCLSCHDGTVTQASFYHVTSGMGGAGSVTAPDIGGTGGLANDHPVDFIYSVALATTDGGLKAPTEGAAVRVPYVGTPALPLYKDQTTDESGRLECATCHNPHSNANDGFLRMSNVGSDLCLNCHGI